ncbi:hypothetical protein [Paramagnetospirillum magneticum]|uniref:Uncharacterized protein n=1 Tax=Paramagnetospirillum magneticum (strain ATCC 700264 / AMB-1) TaxID=342108 RepID=Q2W755_PARM1|nr:hypothetical protein [Paramagnetospirillum magneticum]BAE50320.1 hypothetical protein amb1516 [Paramagnetospirillum magneticum AMB-1]
MSRSADIVAGLALELLQGATGTLDAFSRRPRPMVTSQAYDLARARVVEMTFAGDAAGLAAAIRNAERVVAVVEELGRRVPDLIPGGVEANRAASYVGEG